MTDNELREALRLFLSVRKGEWPLRPDYGLSILTFENLNSDQIAMIVADDIKKYFNTDVTVTATSIDYNSYKLHVRCYNNSNVIDIEQVLKL